jgi:hypothetical protein
LAAASLADLVSSTIDAGGQRLHTYNASTDFYVSPVFVFERENNFVAMDLLASCI